MSTFAVHNTVIEQIHKFRKLCLWRGADLNARQRPKVAWVDVCKSKSEGGLGVIHLKTQNEALLLKHLEILQQRGYPMGGPHLGKLL